MNGLAANQAPLPQPPLAPLSLGKEITRKLFNRNVLLVGLGAITLLSSLTIGISGLSQRSSPSLRDTAAKLSHLGSAAILAGGALLSTLCGALLRDLHHPELLKKFSKSQPGSVEKAIRVATRIPRFLLSLTLDISLLPLVGAILLAAPCFHASNLDSSHVIKERAPILLIHGSSFNQMEWVVGLLFLRCGCQNFGSVFTLDYDGLLSNSGDKGIEDYANDQIKKKVLEIQEKTGQDQIILIGHSLGGLIAGYFAEYTAKEPIWQKPLSVAAVISVDTPWQGTPLLNFITPEESRRHKQMSEEDPTGVRPKLIERAERSHQALATSYYTAASTNDFIVPGVSGLLHTDRSCQFVSSIHSHYSIIAAPHTWIWIRSKLNEIYDKINRVVLLNI